MSDGISMGTDGMSFSLQSRDLIADSIETVMSAQVRTACTLQAQLCGYVGQQMSGLGLRGQIDTWLLLHMTHHSLGSKVC